MARSVDDIVESYAASLEFPPEDPNTIDRIIEIIAAGVSWDNGQRELLRQVANGKDYNGNNTSLMLLLFDVLGGKSKKALAYGIRAFEAFGREPKKLIGLENPDGLVEYVIDTAENLEEIVKLKDTLLREGHFYSTDMQWTHISGREPLYPKGHLVPSVLLAANEIAFRLKDIDARDEQNVENYEKQGVDVLEHLKLWKTRLEAHEAIVIAYQVMASQAEGKKKKNAATAQALEALAAYESLAGTYQAHGFSTDLMEAYARIKYRTDILSTGEAPDELKADYGWRRKTSFTRETDWDQYFREQLFGTKEPEWKKRERQRAQQRTQPGESQPEQPYRVIRDPWSGYSEELQLLGLTKDSSYEEARKFFRDGLKKRRLTFTRMDVGTPEYQLAMKETAAFIDAWKKVELLYIQNQKPQSL